MAKIVLNTKKCKGCFICVSVCPKKALYDSGKINEKGYKIVAIDEDKVRHMLQDVPRLCVRTDRLRRQSKWQKY